MRVLEPGVVPRSLRLVSVRPATFRTCGKRAERVTAAYASPRGTLTIIEERTACRSTPTGGWTTYYGIAGGCSESRGPYGPKYYLQIDVCGVNERTAFTVVGSLRVVLV
jgi:hypothetical protein